MKIKISTQVNASLSEIKKGFTSDLFMALNPPFPPVKLIQFDGCKPGDQVNLELNFLLFKQRWVSDIIEDEDSPSRWYFVDEGVKLPFFLKSWKHHHEVTSIDSKSLIIDDIQFTTGWLLTDLIMYPLLWFQFLYRKPVYKKTFKY